MKPITWPLYFKLKLDHYVYVIPTTDKSLGQYYFFNLKCHTCFFHLGHYLYSWLHYSGLKRADRLRLEQRYLQYQEHIAKMEPALYVLFHEEVEPRRRLEDYFAI